jgi:predicted negative regulator of RcsB-dependent stress response
MIFVHMESQDTATDFVYKVWPQIEANKNKIIGGIIAIVAIVAIYSFVSWNREQSQVAAGEAMTQVLLSLKPGATLQEVSHSYLAVAEDHSGTMAAQRALLQGATVLFSQGDYTNAQKYFQQYLDAHPDDTFSALATLGVAKCYAAENKINDAVGEYQRVINDFSDAQSQTEARFALAQINMQAGNYTEAIRLFQQVAQAEQYGALGTEAAEYAYELHFKVPQPAAAPSSAPAKTPAATATPAAAPAAAPFNLSH